MDFHPEHPVGQIAVDHPLATRVFARYGIDFCCAGARPIGVVCDEMGLDTNEVLTEIAKEVSATANTTTAWEKEPLNVLIDHILATHHVPLYEEMPRLLGMAQKVAEVHYDKDPERLTELVKVFDAIMNELIPHMHKEEEVLFPMIKAGRGATAGGPIEVMNQEHVEVGDMLRRVRELTDGFEVPDHACNTWRALWFGLKAFEEDLHLHIHLENNILFPRALAS